MLLMKMKEVIKSCTQLILSNLTIVSKANTIQLGTNLADVTSVILGLLLSPLNSTEIPLTVDVNAMKNLLERPLPCKIPDFQHHPPPFDQLFEISSSRSAGTLQRIIGSFCEIPLPDESASEIVWSGYWDTILLRLVPIAKLHNLLNGVKANRNVEDSSISIPDCKRDYLLWWNNILLIAGEDKRETGKLQMAIGCNEAVYGGLKYILAFATANSSIQFFMLPLPEKSNPIAISPVYDVRYVQDKINFIVGYINMLRWVVSVSNLPGLFPTTVLPLHTAISRKSPWFPNEEGSASIEAHHAYIVKKMKIPKQHMKPLVTLYRLLAHEDIPHTVKPLKVFIEGKSSNLLDDKIPSKTSNVVSLCLWLSPIGASYTPATETELKTAIKCILQFLVVFHQKGYIHRDIRWPNIIRVGTEWIVIDLELATNEENLVFWNNEYLPPNVAAKIEPYTAKADLYQVGMLVEAISIVSSQDSVDFRTKLKNGQLRSATEALSHSWLS